MLTTYTLHGLLSSLESPLLSRAAELHLLGGLAMPSAAVGCVAWPSSTTALSACHPYSSDLAYTAISYRLAAVNLQHGIRARCLLPQWAAMQEQGNGQT